MRVKNGKKYDTRSKPQPPFRKSSVDHHDTNVGTKGEQSVRAETSSAQNRHDGPASYVIRYACPDETVSSW